MKPSKARPALMLNANLRSIVLMVAGMLSFTLADLLIKIATQTLPVGQVMIMLGVGSTLVFLCLMLLRGEPILLSPLRQPAVMLRNAGDFIGATSMCLALAYVPLSTIGAVIQAVPLMITAAAALFLGEHVGIRRLSAILVGFAGVLFILQPAAADFDGMVFLALIAAIGLSARDIGTKLISSSISTLLLSFYASVLFVMSGGVLLGITGGAAWPDLGVLAMFLAMIALGCLGYIFVTTAVRLGEMSVVSPFRYSRLLFSVAVGVAILGESVDAKMLIGCLLTIGAGLYIWHREIILNPDVSAS
ncbi:MAG: DMT family transporter [Candidatus Puniceispirillaceae bacterium]